MNERARGAAVDGAGPALAWLSHPVTVVALVVLAVNDHLLKQALPGALTGKLSDVAGLVLAAPLLASLTLLAFGRLPPHRVAAWSIAIVGIGFALVKITQVGAGVASAAWSLVTPHSVILADPTDLIALPALTVAWALWRRVRTRPVASRTARLVRVFLVLPAMTLAVAATSQVWVQVAWDVDEVDGQIVLGIAKASPSRGPTELHDAYISASSIDGQVWSSPNEANPWRAFDDPGPTPISCQASVPDNCYRVVPGRLAIEHRSGDGDWRIDWAVSTRDRARLIAYYEPYLSDLAECRSVLVHEVARGYVVVAACGRDGFVRRSADGTWERLGFPPDQPAVDPATLAAPSPFDPVPLGFVIMTTWLAVALGSELVRPPGRLRIWTRFIAAASIFGWWPAYAMLYTVAGIVVLGLDVLVQLGLVIVWLVLHQVQRTLRTRVVVAGLGAGLAAGVIPYLINQGFVTAEPWLYGVAAAMGAAGVVVTAVVGRAVRPASTTTVEPPYPAVVVGPQPAPGPDSAD